MEMPHMQSERERGKQRERKTEREEDHGNMPAGRPDTRAHQKTPRGTNRPRQQLHRNKIGSLVCVNLCAFVCVSACVFA